MAEKKAASGFLPLAAQGQASGTGCSYAALSWNPVGVRRCVRLTCTRRERLHVAEMRFRAVPEPAALPT
ncbi:hypothetical protein ACVJBD_002774 [Rhizobium mongolense]